MRRKHLSGIERMILIGACRDLERWRNTDRSVFNYRGFAAEKIAYAYAADGVVKCRPQEWLAEFYDTSAQSVRAAVSRCYKSLEARGLVERLALASGAVTTHLAITEAGIVAAKEYAADLPAPTRKPMEAGADG